MGRIFAAALWNVRRGDGNSPADLVERMTGHRTTGGGRACVFTESEDGRGAAGLAAGAIGYSRGVSQRGHGKYIISFYGYMPGLAEVLSFSGIDSAGDDGAGIIDLYRKEGERFLEKLPGMFSLVLYDGEKRQMIVAGDRNGYCPVYYSETGDGIRFSSVLGPLLDTREWNGLDRSSLAEYLMFDAICGSRTFYADINIIPYGEYLKVDLDGRKISSGSYFSYESLFDISRYRENRRIDAPAVLTEKVRESVRRLMDGRPAGHIGLMCGGGVDCSFIGGILKEEGIEFPIFCATVKDGEVSEEDMAKVTSEHLGSDFHVGQLSQKMYYPLLLKSIVDFGQPIAHPNLARFYINAGTTTRAGRPEQILGVASDLLFGGQGNVRSFYKYLRLSRLLSFLPENTRRVLAMATGRVDETDLVLRLRNPLHVLSSAGMGNFERAATGRDIAMALEGIEDRSERAVKTMMIENLCDYQQHLLNRRYELATRSGMGLWFPFLDLEVVRFAMNLPVRHCVGWKESKKVVRAAAKPYLGQSLSSRAKWGGDVPTRKWITPLRHLLTGGFLEDQLKLSPEKFDGVFPAQPKLLWNMLDVEIWGRLCLYGEDPEELLDSIRKNGLESNSFESVCK